MLAMKKTMAEKCAMNEQQFRNGMSKAFADRFSMLFPSSALEDSSAQLTTPAQASCDPCMALGNMRPVTAASAGATVEVAVPRSSTRHWVVVGLFVIVGILLAIFLFRQFQGSIYGGTLPTADNPFGVLQATIDPLIGGKKEVLEKPSPSGGAGAVTSPSDVAPAVPTFTMFHADWCGHCKQLLPIFHKLAMENPGKKFRTCDNTVLQQSGLADKLEIRGFPTIIFFNAQLKVDAFVGNQGEAALRQFIDKHSA